MNIFYSSWAQKAVERLYEEVRYFFWFFFKKPGYRKTGLPSEKGYFSSNAFCTNGPGHVQYNIAPRKSEIGNRKSLKVRTPSRFLFSKTPDLINKKNLSKSGLGTPSRLISDFSNLSHMYSFFHNNTKYHISYINWNERDVRIQQLAFLYTMMLRFPISSSAS